MKEIDHVLFVHCCGQLWSLLHILSTGVVCLKKLNFEHPYKKFGLFVVFWSYYVQVFKRNTP